MWKPSVHSWSQGWTSNPAFGETVSLQQYHTIFFWQFKLPKCNRTCYRGFKQIFILLKIHAEMVENTLFRKNVKFWPFLIKCQKVGCKRCVNLNSASITVCTISYCSDIEGCCTRKSSIVMDPFNLFGKGQTNF